MPHFGPLQSSTAKLPDGVAVVVGASPFAFAATSNGIYIVTGGTLSQMSYTRNGTAVNFGTNTRVISMRRGDTVTVTYTGAPTAAFVPDAT